MRMGSCSVSHIVARCVGGCRKVLFFGHITIIFLCEGGLGRPTPTELMTELTRMGGYFYTAGEQVEVGEGMDARQRGIKQL